MPYHDSTENALHEDATENMSLSNLQYSDEEVVSRASWFLVTVSIFVLILALQRRCNNFIYYFTNF